MKIVFMGTPDFAVPALQALIDTFGVEAVFTQPDKPKGRGKSLAISPVKELALKYNIKVLQPQKLRKEEDVIEALRYMSPDFIVVVAYGQILSKEILEIPKYACINLHASLLPKYRGAAPINWAIIKGEEKTGNTTMLMDVGLDTGDMLLKQEVTIEKDMTAGELHDILMNKGAELLIETIKKMYADDGSITPVKQEDSDTCYASMLNKEMAKINWNMSSTDIHNFIRGLNPWPVAYTIYNGVVMKIYKAEPILEEPKCKTGTIIDVSQKGIKVSCKDGAILVKEIQFPGKKVLTVEQYTRGNVIETGTVLT